jgi:hypothetical protein
LVISLHGTIEYRSIEQLPVSSHLYIVGLSADRWLRAS